MLIISRSCLISLTDKVVLWSEAIFTAKGQREMEIIYDDG